MLGVVLGLTACAGGENRPTLPSSGPSIDRPSPAPSVGRPGARPESPAPSVGRPGARPESPDGAESPAAKASTSTRATRTPGEAPAPTSEPARTATTDAAAQPAAPTRTTPRTATAADPATVASPQPGVAVSGTSGGLGTLGWFLLLIVAAGVIGGVLVRRSRRNADWVAGADALTADTHAVMGRRLPSVLATVTAAERALSWPPVRADLVELLGRWALLPENAPGERRADWSRQAWSQLREVLAAVDAENEALAAGRQWRPLRLRVDDAGRALFATLSGRRGAEPDASLS